MLFIKALVFSRTPSSIRNRRPHRGSPWANSIILDMAFGNAYPFRQRTIWLFPVASTTL